MRAGIAPKPHVRQEANGNFDKLGLCATLIISYAKAPLEALANSVGSDMMGDR
jgi:hypothetical protein